MKLAELTAVLFLLLAAPASAQRDLTTRRAIVETRQWAFSQAISFAINEAERGDDYADEWYVEPIHSSDCSRSSRVVVQCTWFVTAASLRSPIRWTTRGTARVTLKPSGYFSTREVRPRRSR